MMSLSRIRCRNPQRFLYFVISLLFTLASAQSPTRDFTILQASDETILPVWSGGSKNITCDVCAPNGTAFILMWGEGRGQPVEQTWVMEPLEMAQDVSKCLGKITRYNLQWHHTLKELTARLYCQLLPTDKYEYWVSKFFDINVYSNISEESIVLKIDGATESGNVFKIEEKNENVISCNVPALPNYQKLNVFLKLDSDKTTAANSNISSTKGLQYEIYNNKILECGATYRTPAGQEISVSRTVRLNIIYSPRISMSVTGLIDASVSAVGGATASAVSSDAVVKSSSHLVEESTTLTFQCSGEAQPPIQSWSWSMRLANSEKSEDVGSGQNYVVAVGREHDGAVVTCRAKNEEGDSASSYTVNVKYSTEGPPVYRPRDPAEPMVLKCTSLAEGGKYTWSHAGVTIANATAAVLQLPAADSKSSSKEGIFGSYRCSVTDKVGMVKSNTFIIVPRGKITQLYPSRVVEVAAGFAVTLNCVTSGLPRPRIQWKYRGIIVTRHKSTTSDLSGILTASYLTLRSVEEKDFGLYTCIASGSNFSVQATVSLVRRDTLPLLELVIGASCGAALLLLCCAIIIWIRLRKSYQSEANDSWTSSLKFSDTVSIQSGREHSRNSGPSPIKLSPEALSGQTYRRYDTDIPEADGDINTAIWAPEPFYCPVPTDYWPTPTGNHNDSSPEDTTVLPPPAGFTQEHVLATDV